MKATIQLKSIYVHDEADGSGNAEPFLWPIYFKIDLETVLYTMMAKTKLSNNETWEDIWDKIKIEDVSWLRMPSGAHGNIGGDVDEGDTIQIPTSVGETSFNLIVDQKDSSWTQVGCIVVLLEEDDAPSDSDIREAYSVFAKEVAVRVFKTVSDKIDNSKKDSTGSNSGFSIKDVEKEIANKLKDKLDHWLVNVDDFIGVKFLLWSRESLLATPYQTFKQRWDSSTGSEDGSFSIFGAVKATDLPPVVVIYQHADYKGARKAFQPGKYAMQELGIGNDQLSSLRVPAGLMATLYRNHLFTGDHRIVLLDTNFIGQEFNDQTSSMEIEQCAVIFQHAQYRGAFQNLAPGKYNMKDLSFGHDTLSSARVPKGWKVTLYMHHNFQGPKKILMQDTKYVGDTFNDQVSSLVVERN